MASATPFITITSPLQYSEALSGDIDTYTAYTDVLGQPSRALWVLNQVGNNTWTGHIASPTDSVDVLPLYIPTGYALQGYTLSLSNIAVNNSAMFDLSSSDGNSFNDNRPLAAFNDGQAAPSGMYNLTLGGGVNVMDYVLTLNIIKVNEAPTISEDALYPTFYSAGAAVTLFSNVQVSTVEAGQHIASFSLSVDGVKDASEVLTLNNVDVHLAAGQNGSLGAGVNFAVTDSNGSILVSLSMTGNFAPADLQSLLNNMTYKNSAAQPTLGDRQINLLNISDDGGTANGGKNSSDLFDTSTVTVAGPANAAPILVTSAGTTAFVEGNNTTSTPVVVDSGITVSDSDNATLISATVSVTGNFHASEDLLALTTFPATMGNIDASYNSETGVLTLTSSEQTATLAQWQAALSSVTYTDTSDTPSPVARTISFSVNDGTTDSVANTRTVTVASVNDSPVLINSSGTSAFTEGNNQPSTPVVIDSGLTVTDSDSTTLNSATVTVSGNFHAGEDLLAFTNDSATMGNIDASYNSETGVLTLTSSGQTATLAQWQAALSSVTYTDTSDTPDTSPRTISFVVNDGSTPSVISNKVITVTSVNDAPVILATATTAQTFTEGSAATVINAGLLVTDADNSTLVSATVAISNLVAGEDVLSFTNNPATMGDIVASYVAATGILTLTSNSHATLAQWQAALSSVSYQNTSHAPTGTDRTIQFSVNDGDANSQKFTQTINLVAVNDAPVVSLSSLNQSVLQDVALTFNAAHGNLISISDVDAGNSSVQVTLTAAHGLLTLGSITGLTFTVGTGTSDASISVTGTLTQINAALNGLTFTPTAGYTGNASINIVADDLGNSGGAAQTADQTITVNVGTTPQQPETPPVIVDGVAVITTPTVLPNGETGSSVNVGLVTDSRQDDTGSASTADINLVGTGSSVALSAKLPVGYGLTAAGGALKAAGASGETLKAAIDAVTASTDQAHQNVNGQHFLDKLAANTSLLVESITPVTSATAPTQALQIDGSANSSQLTALVIDAGQMNGKGSLLLNNVDFAAIVGQTTVQGNTTGQVLTGDDASQSFIVNASNSFVFAGGGNDTLQITSFAAANNSTLQGGQGDDTVQFSGDRSLYNIEQHGGFTVVSSKDDPSQQVKVVNVESLGFADGVVSIQTDAQQTTLAALYQSILGRQADVGGFDFWTQQPLSIGGVALSILTSTEAGAASLNGQASHDIGALYSAFFGRAADAAGQAYWAQQVEQGHLSLVQVADSLLTSIEMTAHNKAPSTWDFTV